MIAIEKNTTISKLDINPNIIIKNALLLPYTSVKISPIIYDSGNKIAPPVMDSPKTFIIFVANIFDIKTQDTYKIDNKTNKSECFFFILYSSISMRYIDQYQVNFSNIKKIYIFQVTPLHLPLTINKEQIMLKKEHL